MAFNPIEVAALGRPLFPGMIYDCRRDSFIPGVTLWDKKLLSKDLDIRPHRQTDLKFSSSDSFSSKASLMDISASLKASFLGGLVEVEGSAKYLHDTKSSNQQSRVTMYYGETSRFEQLTMTQLGKITYPQVFDQKTATHVVTGVLYGARAFMVFDRMFSEDENKEKIEGELNVMVKKIPLFSIDGKGAVKMTDAENQEAENISCTFHGDFFLKQTPTTFHEAVDLYRNIPVLMNDNAVPIRVWLYPLHLLKNEAAQLVREISTTLFLNTQDIMQGLERAERANNDLLKNKILDAFSDVKERLCLFQESFNIYKMVFQKDVARLLPGIRGGGVEEKSLHDILKLHYESPFVVSKLNQWLHDAKSELQLLSAHTKSIGPKINIEDSDSLNTILLDPNVDAVVCLNFTSLKYEDPYLKSLTEFLKSDKFKDLNEGKTLDSVCAVKWFRDADVITKMRKNLFLFRGFSEANKDEKSICFIISALSDTSNKGSSIYLYEQGKLKEQAFEPVSKPPPPTIDIADIILDKSVCLKLQTSPTGVSKKFRVEYQQVKADSEAKDNWLVKDTDHEIYTLTGLEPGKPYLIRYRIVSTVGMSEASDTVRFITYLGLHNQQHLDKTDEPLMCSSKDKNGLGDCTTTTKTPTTLSINSEDVVSL